MPCLMCYEMRGYYGSGGGGGDDEYYGGGGGSEFDEVCLVFIFFLIFDFEGGVACLSFMEVKESSLSVFRVF